MAVPHRLSFRQHTQKFFSVSLQDFPSHTSSFSLLCFRFSRSIFVSIWRSTCDLRFLFWSFTVIKSLTLCPATLVLPFSFAWSAWSLVDLTTALGGFTTTAIIVCLWTRTDFFKSFVTRIYSVQCAYASSTSRAGSSRFVVLWLLRISIFSMSFLNVATITDDSVSTNIVISFANPITEILSFPLSGGISDNLLASPFGRVLQNNIAAEREYNDKILLFKGRVPRVHR